ncbi:MAG: hypothetical protein OJF59_001694 [Cytophagales bacterium]|mgnify:CR=1 FL=1|jgi:four helix bundle protein|nr:four helix bundle protein [Bacteroidota bacterium]MBS1980619.1 four helix bundle protein [Bacteroidota bacterium]WHZ07941.1 MAG: hypothetical protein OJF59_001694 [Cytophagales bacterium]
MDIVDKVYDRVQMLPQEMKYGLRSQMTGGIVSVSSNTAAGRAKRNVQAQTKFYQISLRPAFEFEANTQMAQRKKRIKKKTAEEMLRVVTREQKVMVRFIEKVEG